MNQSKVSVIIPTYNGAKFLGETIQSVLGQTYTNFELILVDDASSDNTTEVIAQFQDSRIKSFAFEVNQGQDSARLYAIRQSSGEILALLDQDDLFHPEKLQLHVSLLEKCPTIGCTYNARFELNYSANTIREIWRPPQIVSLVDLILGFPIAPSDLVIRREWAPYLDLSQDGRLLNGGEYLITGRLFLSGCQFAGIDRALNYRRFYTSRNYSNLLKRCESELSCQEKIIKDPRCPAEVLAVRDKAFANTYFSWAYYALIQDETQLGQEFIHQAVRLNPTLLDGNPCELMNLFQTYIIADENLNHETLLKQIIDQLPEDMVQRSNYFNWAVSRGYLHKAVRAIIWDRIEDGIRYFEKAASWGVLFDDSLINQLTQYLLDYSNEFGDIAAQKKIHALTPHIEKLGGSASVRRLTGCYTINSAFHCFHNGEYSKVPKYILLGVAENPGYLTNRGVHSVFFRSILHKFV
jgi:glycosyltransferase involved in cell wall biosynthesis